jgi:hypothetical protein
MPVKASVYICIQVAEKKGLTVPEFLEANPDLKPQTVYPCFTQLYKAKKILDSKQRRKSKNNRRSIVWVDAKYGGTIPVWGSGQPSYSYRNRAKVVMDLLAGFGPLSVSEMMTSCTSLKPMSTSSLVSRLVKQQWVRKTNKTRLNQDNQTCCLYDLTPRGKQVRDQSPRKDLGTFATPPTALRRDTEKTRA